MGENPQPGIESRSAMTAVVRVATIADAAELSQVGTRSFGDAYRGTADDADIDRHLVDYFGEAAIRHQLALADVRYLIATLGENTAGLAKLRYGRAPPPFGAASAVEIQQLYVASDYQRSGVGRQLVDATIADAGQRGVEGIWLSTWKHADWAVAFYRGLGFDIVGEAPFQLGCAEFTDYLMWYSLD